MSLFKRNKPGSVGLGRDVSGIEDEPAVSVAIPPSPRFAPSEESDVPEPSADALGDLDALITETSGGPKATGRVRLSKEERTENARVAKEARASVKADKIAAKAERKAAKDSGEVLAKMPRKPFSMPGRKKASDDTDDFEPIEGSPDVRLSGSVIIEFLQGYTKDDAVTWAKRWAMDKMTVPSDCYYYVQKYPGGFAVEVQEGVGQAYLPSVINLASRNQGRIVIVPMSRRKMTVMYVQRADDFEATILPEGQEPPATGSDPLHAVRSAKMKPIMQQNVQWLYAGVGTSVIGGLFLMASLLVYSLDPSAKVPPEWRTTAIPRLPIMQWSRLQPDATDSYVVRMEFSDGQWRIIRQAAGATAEVATPDAVPDAAIVGGAVAAPAAADTSVPPPPPPGVVITPNGANRTAPPTQIPPPSAVRR